MTDKRKDDHHHDQNSDNEAQEDYLEEEHPGKTREEALADEQGEESFPASDPPGNF